MDTTTAARWALGGLLTAEGAVALRRFAERKRLFREAQARATATGRPLVVVGAPGNGAHTGLIEAYGCGDVCVDLVGCAGCPVSVAVDLTRESVARVAPDSAVVYVSCVLEYVTDIAAAWREILRMAGSAANAFVVPVGGYSLTSRFYPGAHWVIDAAPPSAPDLRYHAVTPASKLAYAAAVAGLAVASVRWTPRENPAPRRARRVRRRPR